MSLGKKLLPVLKKELAKEDIILDYTLEEFANKDVVHHLMVTTDTEEYIDKNNSLENLIGRYLLNYKK